jgi:membrane-associated phospholipid phosphatase
VPLVRRARQRLRRRLRDLRGGARPQACDGASDRQPAAAGPVGLAGAAASRGALGDFAAVSLMSTREASGLAWTLGLSVLLFSLLGVGVASGGPIVSFDSAVAVSLHSHATGFATDVMSTVTQLGGATVLLAVTLVAGVALLVRRRVAHAALMGAALAGAEALNLALKATFERPRPSLSDPIATAAGFSFPSGHAMVALTVYGALAFITAASGGSRRRQVMILGAATGLVLAIGFSRLYLGVHYVSDVLAGYGAGLAWLMVCGLTLLGASRLRGATGGSGAPHTSSAAAS